MPLPEVPDWHTHLLNEALANGKPVPGELDDYVKLSGQNGDVGPVEVFGLFVKRWVHPTWHPHLADDDDNEAEYVRRAINLAIVKAAAGGFAAGAAAVQGKL